MPCCQCEDVFEGFSSYVSYVVPTICQPLVCQPISACVQQSEAFSGLDQSDGETGLQVDMLIGSDYYWDLVTRSICKIEGGPIAVYTKLG